MSYYDNYAKRDKISKIGRFFVKNKNEFFIQKILRYSSKSEGKIRILEIGPGKGFFAEDCRRKGFDYEAIEENSKMCELLKKRKFKVFNLSVPPINLDSKFDVIFMDQVLEHMEDRKSVLDVFEHCGKRLNQGGLLVVSVPDITFFKEDFWGSDYTHSSPFSLYTLKQIFTDFDFEIKYSNVSTLLFNGMFITSLIKLIVTFLYNTGLFHLIFRKKAYKIKNLGNASCIVIGMKKGLPSPEKTF